MNPSDPSIASPDGGKPPHEVLSSGGRWRMRPAVLVSLALTVGTLILSSFLAPVSREMYNVLLLPIALSAYVGGLGVGLIAVFLSVVGTAFHFLARVKTFSDAQPRDVGELLIVAATGTVICILIHLLQKARRQAAAVPLLVDQLTRVAASVPGVIYAFRLRPDGSFCIPYASPRVGEFFGLTVGNLAEDGSMLFEVMHPEDRPRVLAAIEESARRLTPWRGEFRIRHAVKGEVWIEGQSLPQREADGGTLWHGFVSDRTDYKKAEAVLKERERRYQTLFELSPAGILLEDEHGRIVEANPAICEMLGAPREDLIGRNVRIFVPAEEQDRVERNIAQILGGRTLHHEVQNVGPDGTARYIDLRETAVPLPDGRPGILAIVDDVTDRRRSEVAVRESERLYRQKEATLRALLDSIPDLVFIKDRESIYRGCNKAFEEFVGLKEGELIGKSEYDLAPREEAEGYLAEDRAMIATGHVLRKEHWLAMAGRPRRLFDTIKTPFRSTDDGLVGIVGVSRDITERQRAQLALGESRERYRFLFENMLEGFAYCSLLQEEHGRLDFTFLEVNPSFERLTGLRAVKGRRAGEAIPGLQVSNPRLLALFGRVARTGKAETSEDYIEPLKQWFSVSAYSPSPGYFAAMFTVITDRKRAEQGLRQSEERFRSILDSMLEGCQIVGFDRRYLYVNESAARYGRKPREELLGRRMTEVYPGFDQTALHASIVQCLDSRQAIQMQSDFQFADGSVRWFDLSLHPVPEGVFILSIDITERRQEEDLLRQSEERFRLLFDRVSRLAVQGYGPDGTVRMWNKASEELYGYTAAEAVGRNLTDLIIPPHMKEAVQGAVRHMVETGMGNHAEELLLMRRDGSLVPVYSNHTVVDVHGRGRELYCIDIDLTERKRAESGLRLQSVALEAAANAIVITDRDGTVEWANPAFAQISGYGTGEAIGRKMGELVKSGEHDAAFYDALWATIRDGRVWRGEFVNRRKDGTHYTAETTITPVRDELGAVVHFIGIQQDITDRKQLEARLLRTRHLEGIGRLASGIARDLTDILTPMLLGPPILRETLREPVALAIVDTIEARARRGAAVVKQLRTLGTGPELRREPVALQTLLREVLAGSDGLLPAGIAVRSSAPDDLPPVPGDDEQLRLVVATLCAHARDAMPAGGELVLALSAVEVSPALARVHDGTRPGPHVLLTVRDTGDGLSAEALDRLFVPFSGGSEAGEGGGLGLSVVSGIVRSHGGFIEVDSAPGRGTEFRVHLPARAAPRDDPAVAAAPSPQGRGETVLVVDDEELLRKLARRMLEHGGYRVLEACNGEAALNVLNASNTPVAVVLTDLLMPVMDGPTFIRAVRQTHGNTRIISMSGYLTQPELIRALEAETQIFLPKPFGPQDLMAAVRRALSA